jgi:ubiquinone/menaquinone biosynthesis C-methylase UbiE
MKKSNSQPEPSYNTIGKNYNVNRRADPLIIATLKTLLDLPHGSLVADIGAGTGNYANAMADLGYRVIAVEPSEVMRKQAVPHENVKWLAGTAESLPLKDASVAGVIIVLAIHHFSSVKKTAAELHRICPGGPVVLLTYDPRRGKGFWFNEYFPEIYRREFELFPPIDEMAVLLAGNDWQAEISEFPLPRDLADKNMHSGWGAPKIYFNEQMRLNTSGFAKAGKAEVEKGLSRLKEELRTGEWDAKYGHLRKQDSLDTGFVFLKLCAMN